MAAAPSATSGAVTYNGGDGSIRTSLGRSDNLETQATNRISINEPAVREHCGLVETAEAAPVLLSPPIRIGVARRVNPALPKGPQDG